MVTKRQRRRRIAREKWERQQQRRTSRARRRRRINIVVGTTLGVLAVIGAGLLIARLVADDSSTGANTRAPVTPVPRATTASGDRLPGSGHGTAPAVAASGVAASAAGAAEGPVGSKPGEAGATRPVEPTAAGDSSRADRPEALVVIKKPRIVA